MRIVIDMQGAQRELAQPGQLGEFSLKVAQALIGTRREHEVVLLLSDFYASTIEPLRDMFRNALGPRCFHIWYSVPCWHVPPGAPNWRLACAKLIKEAAVASLKPDVFIVPSGRAAGEADLWGIPVFPTDVSTLGVIEEGADESRLPQTGDRNASVRVAASVPVDDIWDAARRLAAARPEQVRPPFPEHKPRLAYVSPLPPERSGIADYSAALLPALGRFYDVDVVASQRKTSDPWIASNCTLRSPDWFAKNHSRYQRVVYHFGNSKFHDYMFDLLELVPGVVVLHDFFLGDIQLIREQEGLCPNAWARALYEGHGYRAAMDRFNDALLLPTLASYPANLDVLRLAKGVIVHSEHARALARDFYGSELQVECAVVPLARATPPAITRAQARAKLGISADDFVVCSVGYMNPAKLHDRILAAWRLSKLSQDTRCRLFFVGGSDGPHGAYLDAAVKAPELGGRVRITGWVDSSAYHDYLAAADLAVQLRMNSRGETSAAALDCMSHALPTIVNANGSMAELPADAVRCLPDSFTDAQLVEAMESIWQQPDVRAGLGSRALQWIERHHSPDSCAQSTAAAIERIHGAARVNGASVARELGLAAGAAADVREDDFAGLALDLARSLPRVSGQRQLLVDVSAIARTDLKTGIQRVVRALIWELVQAPPPGFRIEPVYMTNEGSSWHYRYARTWTSSLLGIPAGWADDDVAEFSAGDVLLVADFTSAYLTQAQRNGTLQAMRDAGVEVNFTVYDLLPLRMPDKFPPGTAKVHEDWFASALAAADRAVCISQAVAKEVSEQVEAIAPQRAKPLEVSWFHLGADIEQSLPTGGMLEDVAPVMAGLEARPSFLMVSTVEPRKGHAQSLAAFEKLWERGLDLNLVIVGKRGWMVDSLCTSMRDHPEAGKRLWWIEGASDEYLQKLYAACTCLIAASEGEGFGLPLIEAAQHGLPVIARDIPVFREVAGEFATYFEGSSAEALADTVERWLQLRAAGKVPAAHLMPWLTWRQSVRQLLRCLRLDGGYVQPEPTCADIPNPQTVVSPR